MRAEPLKKLLIRLATGSAVLIALLGILVILVEARFRPRASAEVTVPAHLGYLQGRVTEASGWIPFMLPGIARAEISLAPGEQGVVTDDDGNFVIADIRPGVYAVTLAADGFEAAVVEGVAIGGGTVTELPDEALFPAIEGPPVARLKLGSAAPFGTPPESWPYLTTVYLDATDSENISRYGIRFEFRDEYGKLLTDPYSDNDEPLQPEKSPVPGTSPALFLFQPPRPGQFTARLILTNEAAPGVEDVAEVTVDVVNAAPRALPFVIAGPQPPRKRPTAERRASSGLNVVRLGDPVYLMGLGLDLNHASPERYNPGGVQPDLYGKNHDHLQRQFGFTWQLFFIGPDSGDRVPANNLLRAPDGSSIGESQLVHFTPAQAGQYEAVLAVSDNDRYGSLTGDEASLTVLVVDDDAAHDGTACAACHEAQVESYGLSAHEQAGVGCERCHGPAGAHLAIKADAADYAEAKRATQALNLESGVCGQCHAEYGEWEKSRHADGMPFGHYEIARPLLVQCSKCHYARTFAATVAIAADTGVAFHDVEYKMRAGGIGPLMPDLSKVPAAGETAISCVACHDPHEAVAGESVGLRTGDAGALCQTCHEEKWQNAILEGTAGIVRNGYEYPGEDYAFRNPHNTPAKCVLCHLGDRDDAVDARGVRAVGGHTLRMRDAGVDQRLGGFGPSPADPQTNRAADTSDDVLHLSRCLGCHQDIDSFDWSGAQGEIHASWAKLGNLLTVANGGKLPGYRPGDKCATCHRGGTLPFDDDPALVLENAYTNYKLVMNDRSWGVHNPQYVRKLLADSMAAVEAYLAAHGTVTDSGPAIPRDSQAAADSL